jgi:hypothetical protein
MDIPLEIWLRTDNHATSHVIRPVDRDPAAWTDDDVDAALTGMRRAIGLAHDPAGPSDRPIALRGFSWIVSPYEDGGVVIALELSLGAVIAGPFNVPERELTQRITRVMEKHRLRPGDGNETVH